MITGFIQYHHRRIPVFVLQHRRQGADNDSGRTDENTVMALHESFLYGADERTCPVFVNAGGNRSLHPVAQRAARPGQAEYDGGLFAGHAGLRLEH